MTQVVYLDCFPPARMPRDQLQRRMLHEEQSTAWKPVATFGDLIIEMRWVCTAREGWLWEDRARQTAARAA
jgi:hypothetical protein